MNSANAIFIKTGWLILEGFIIKMYIACLQKNFNKNDLMVMKQFSHSQCGGKGKAWAHLIPICYQLECIHTLINYVSVRNLSRGTHVHYLRNLYKKYGQVISFRAGVQTLIWINDGKLLAELFKTDQMALRPIETLPVLQQLSGGSSRGLWAQWNRSVSMHLIDTIETIGKAWQESCVRFIVRQ